MLDKILLWTYIKCTTTNSTLNIVGGYIPQKGDIMIIIDYKDTRPIYEQVVERFKTLILKGVMQPDEQMPSVRSLAMELSINPNTIQKAYAELERQGFIYSVKGRGSFVLGDSSLVEQRKREYVDQILKLVREVLEIGMTKMEIVLEIENLQV